MWEDVRLERHKLDPLLHQLAVLDLAALDQRVNERSRDAVSFYEPLLQPTTFTNEIIWRHDIDVELLHSLVEILRRLHLRSFHLGRLYNQYMYALSWR